MSINIATKSLLNIGCGTASTARLPKLFQDPFWVQTRVDIDPTVKPDIVASFTDLSMFEDDSVDAIWSSHNLEHIPWHEIGLALGEAMRVMKPEGFLMITLPDIEQVAQLVVEGKLMEVAYESPAGPITALDMMYGHRESQASGHHFMAHRCAFTADSLGRALMEAGFTEIKINKGNHFDLWGLASCGELPAEALEEIQWRKG